MDSIKSMFSPAVKRVGIALGIAGVVAVGMIGNMGQVTPGPPVPYPLNDYRSTHLEWTEEFLLNSPGTGDVFTTSSSGAGTAAIVTNAGGAGVRPGVLGLATGTTSTGRIGRRTSSPAVMSGDWTKTTYEWVGCIPTLSTGAEEFALILGAGSSDTTVEQAGGCYVVYDRGNVHASGCNTGNADKLAFVCANGGTRTYVLLDGTSQNGSCSAGSITTVNTPVAACTLPNTNFMNVKIEINGTTSATVTVNGTLRATITSNLPTSGGGTWAFFNVLKSAGTTSRTVYVDRHRLAFDLPSARTP